MQRCRRAFSASHYAMATVIVSVAATIFSWVSGALNEWLGNVAFFTLAFLASFPSLVLVHFVPKDPTGALAASRRRVGCRRRGGPPLVPVRARRRRAVVVGLDGRVA